MFEFYACFYSHPPIEHFSPRDQLVLVRSIQHQNGMFPEIYRKALAPIIGIESIKLIWDCVRLESHALRSEMVDTLVTILQTSIWGLSIYLFLSSCIRLHLLILPTAWSKQIRAFLLLTRQ